MMPASLDIEVFGKKGDRGVDVDLPFDLAGRTFSRPPLLQFQFHRKTKATNPHFTSIPRMRLLLQHQRPAATEQLA